MSGEPWQIGPLRVEPQKTLRGVFQVDVGPTRINFPIALINGTEPDPVVLVTAGMDGDEYAGCEAALRLIDALDPVTLAGRVMVCPILDPLSFEALSSQNPLDGLFLKNVFPGDLEGKPTQRLAHFIHHYFITPADAWIDLQSADVVGDAVPFVWTAQVADAQINEQNRALLSYSEVALGLLTAPRAWGPLEAAAAASTAVLVSQAGRRLRTEEDAINFHLQVIQNVLAGLAMLPPTSKAPPAQVVYLDREIALAEHTGLWYPQVRPGDEVTVGQVLGEIYTFDGDQVLQRVESAVNGLVLAVQTGLATRPRLGLALIAHRKQQG